MPATRRQSKSCEPSWTWTACVMSACCISLSVAGCNRGGGTSTTAKQSPAQVSAVVNEEQLNTIQLSPAAEERLAIATAAVETRDVSRVRVYGGEILLPPGAALTISAPLGGTLRAPAPGGVPAVGDPLAEKQPVFVLTPLLSPEREVLTPAERIRFAESRNMLATSRIDAEAQAQQAFVQVDAARIALERAERLFRESAGPARTVDEAKAQLALATRSLEAAESRRKLLASLNLDEAVGELTPLVIESPQPGIVRARHAAAGEVVASGAALFEVWKLDPVWVRVPVYVGEATEVAADDEAIVGELAARANDAGAAAQPVRAPPTAAPLASNVDLYYELPNPHGALRPGQRVSVRVKLRDPTASRVIPWSAVLHDIHGGNWVYERTAPHTYVRRRVTVRYVVDGLAVLEHGPAENAQIVTAGAMELFGTETGFAK